MPLFNFAWCYKRDELLKVEFDLVKKVREGLFKKVCLKKRKESVLDLRSKELYMGSRMRFCLNSLDVTDLYLVHSHFYRWLLWEDNEGKTYPNKLIAWWLESACSAGDVGSVPGLGRSRGEGRGYPLQYSCLENSMDRGAWWATVHKVSKSWTQLSN